MPIAHAFIKLGRFIGLASILFLSLVPVGQADYANPAIPSGETAAHWLDQGGMLCTYGNFKAAVHAYEKALALAPNDSEVHFSLGVAYTEMGDYTNALVSIEKAISLAPDQARYQYGRAWCLLLAGRTAEARPDFQRAAELGSTDAQNYLQRQATGP
jgi:Flp pilus assembly protein TadD